MKTFGQLFSVFLVLYGGFYGSVLGDAASATWFVAIAVYIHLQVRDW